MYKIETPGERLYNLRKKYKITQNQIAGEDCTRALISSIELGKSKLIKETANKIVINFNKILISKGTNEKITVKYLLEDKDKQTEDVIDNFIGNMKLISAKNNYQQDLENIIEDLEKFFIAYEISSEAMCKVYEEISNTYIKLYEYEKAKLFMKKCLSFSYLGNERLIKYYNDLIKINYRLGDFKEIINLFEIVKVIIARLNLKDSKEEKYIYFNASLAYGYSNMYDNALKCLEGLENTFDYMGNIKVRMQKANCLMELNNFEFAEYEFNRLLKDSLENQITEISSLSYINLAIIEKYKGNYEKSNEYCVIAAEIKVDDINAIAKNLYYISDIFIQIDNVDNLELYYKKAFTKLINANNRSMIESLVRKMTNYYIEKKYTEKLDGFIKFLYKNYKSIYFEGLTNTFIRACDHNNGKKTRISDYNRMATEITKYHIGKGEKI